jgi:hypothetical protein
MADSVIDTELIILKDNWPETGQEGWAGPANCRIAAVDALGWEGQNAATAAFELGTKFKMFQDGGTGIPRGWSTFIYLKVGTQNPDILLSCVAATNKCLCCPEDLSEDGTAIQMYTVTNDGDGTTMEPTGLVAVALSAITDTYHGWFWCGGVAPISYLSGLAGDLPTANTVAIGAFVCAATTIANNPLGLIVATAPNVTAGIAFAADD